MSDPNRQELNRLVAEAEADAASRAKRMPTERDAIAAMFDAYLRLKELGWNDAIYCPKDGTPFLSIEAGSTGIHPTHYSGTWPKGSWWVSEAGDLWPSRPILFKPKEANDDGKPA